MQILFFTVLPGLIPDRGRGKLRLNDELRAIRSQLRARVPQEWSELHLGGIEEDWEGGSTYLRPEHDGLWMAKQLGLNPDAAKLSPLLCTPRVAPEKLRAYLKALPDQSLVIADALIAMRLLGKPVDDGSVFRIGRKRDAPSGIRSAAGRAGN